MKLVINLQLLAAFSVAAQTEPIRTFTLNEKAVLTIPVARTRVTTVSFPGPIEAIDAANVSADPRLPGEFQLSYQPGNSFFSVRALGPSASGNVNVVWRKKPYVLLLIETNTPFLSVLLREPVTPEMLLTARPSMTPLRLVGLLETARAYPLLRTQHEEAVRGVQMGRLGQVSDLGDCDIKIEEAFRFEQEDALVFRLLIKNKTRLEFRYDPASLSVRVGGRMFPQAISDASGVVPPLAEEPAYLVISGAPDGGRNDLSLKNDFSIHLRALASVNAASISALRS
jgi:hypothetical protein